MKSKIYFFDPNYNNAGNINSTFTLIIDILDILQNENSTTDKAIALFRFMQAISAPYHS